MCLIPETISFDIEKNQFPSVVYAIISFVIPYLVWGHSMQCLLINKFLLCWNFTIEYTTVTFVSAFSGNKSLNNYWCQWLSCSFLLVLFNALSFDSWRKFILVYSSVNLWLIWIFKLIKTSYSQLYLQW